MSDCEVTRIYLEMRERAELSSVQSHDQRIRAERIRNCPPSFFRYLYREVGRNYHWAVRLGWTACVTTYLIPLNKT